MAKFKLVISDPETGKSRSLEVEGSSAQSLLGKKVGDTIDGSLAKMTSAKLQLTGGSDKDGTPIKPTVHGGVRTSLMLSGGVGFSPSKRGERKRKLVHGNVITDDVYQINLKIVEKPKKSKIKRMKSKKKKLRKPVTNKSKTSK